jgi:C1A family cysteine protease
MRIRTLSAVIGLSIVGGFAGSNPQPQGKPALMISPSANLGALYQALSDVVAPLPSSYDLRKLFQVTPVRNQIPIVGTTLFGVYGSLESTLKPLENWDFSENHLDKSSYGGGFLEAKIGALARWADPVPEVDDPWLSSPAGLPESAVKHVQKVVFLPPRAEALDNDRIKQAVIDIGAVYAEMYYAPELLNKTYASYFNEISTANLQAVAIVGWDDTFDKAKFIFHPPGNGAFICKNSYGSNFGEAGYFFVSYYDAFLGRFSLNAVFTAEPAAGLTHNYQHDLIGCTARIGFGAESAWFANQFVSVATDPLRAVSFYSYHPAAIYEIFVYRDSTPGLPRSGILAARIAGSLDAPGYMTVNLPAPIPLLINQRFSVVVKMETPGDAFPIPIEHPVAGFNAPFQAAAAESFISPEGTIWTDLTQAQGTTYLQSNVCLKAFAGYAPIYPPAQLRVDRIVNNLVFYKEYVDRLIWFPHPDNTEIIVGYRIYRKEKGEANDSFQLLAQVGTQNLVYYVRGLKKDKVYVYRVTAVAESGREGDPSEIEG